jgi:hypothetical protein
LLEISHNPSEKNGDALQIEEDWLHHFRTLAAARSNAEIQALLGKILAGEICQPGSFSPATMDVIAKLDQRTAKGFEEISSLAIIIPNHPDLLISTIIDEDMVSVRYLINDMFLRHLESIGLLQSNTGGGINIGYFADLPPSTLGGERILFSSCTPDPRQDIWRPPHNSQAWPLSEAGMQLAPLLIKKFNYQYAQNLRDGLERIGLKITFPDVDINKEGLVSDPI